jgi:hypothetical protein
VQTGGATALQRGLDDRHPTPLREKVQYRR